MLDSTFSWAVIASVGTHVVGIATAAALGVGHATPPPAVQVPVDIVKIEETPPPPPPPTPKAEKKAPAPKVVRRVAPVEPAPIQPSKLIEDTAVLDTPAPKIASSSDIPTNAMVSQPNPVVSGAREGGPTGAGKLFGTGDFAVKPGSGVTGGSGASGRAGTGLASAGASDASSAGVTSFAKPLGGYQTKPRYPESARTAGIEGVSLLRFVVLADGLVGTVNVEKSAGHPELDRAAVEAVKSWRFEPARRGKEAVAVWVTIPVRFELTHN